MSESRHRGNSVVRKPLRTTAIGNSWTDERLSSLVLFPSLFSLLCSLRERGPHSSPNPMLTRRAPVPLLSRVPFASSSLHPGSLSSPYVDHPGSVAGADHASQDFLSPPRHMPLSEAKRPILICDLLFCIASHILSHNLLIVSKYFRVFGEHCEPMDATPLLLALGVMRYA